MADGSFDIDDEKPDVASRSSCNDPRDSRGLSYYNTGVVISEATLEVTTRAYLSTHHLYAAYFAAEQAIKEESEPDLLSPVLLRHRGFVMSAITSAVCFKEAAINEVLKDAADDRHSYTAPLGEGAIRTLSAIWRNSGDRLAVLDKYSISLESIGKAHLVKGDQVYQDAQALIRLRNYLVHYKPHDVASDDRHTLEKMLRGKFPDNQLSRRTGEITDSWFPYAALGAGCATWAWRAARSFVDEFSVKMGITLNYSQMISAFVTLPD